MSPTLDPGLTTPSGRFRTFWHSNSLGPWGLPSSLRQICSRSRCAPMPRPSDHAATARFKPRFKAPSSNRTTPQVDQAMHAKAFADFAQLRATGRRVKGQSFHAVLRSAGHQLDNGNIEGGRIDGDRSIVRVRHADSGKTLNRNPCDIRIRSRFRFSAPDPFPASGYLATPAPGASRNGQAGVTLRLRATEGGNPIGCVRET